MFRKLTFLSAYILSALEMETTYFDYTETQF